MRAVKFAKEEEDSAANVPDSVTLGTTDWTAETLISAIDRDTIQLSPRFQRRDAWDIARKSRFIESMIVGLPIPQLVLAESANSKGKFIVLDGKQRLLALLQYWGKGTGKNNAFPLKGLDMERHLAGVSFRQLSQDPTLKSKHDALLNHTIRTVVIRGWHDITFLHTVFLRLNTASLPLSSQELRQAAYPGAYTDALDDFCVNSSLLQDFLGLSEPDYRMRDAELVARFVAFAMFLERYQGRMKRFLDDSFEVLNRDWAQHKTQVGKLFVNFEASLQAAEQIFGKGDVARKPPSRHLNKAVFDALVFHLRTRAVRDSAVLQRQSVQDGYNKLVARQSFAKAVERATADVSNTYHRLSEMGKMFAQTAGAATAKLKVEDTSKGQRIKHG
jgi:hypothetical protein